MVSGECNWLSAQAVYGCQPPEGNRWHSPAAVHAGILNGHLGMETWGETVEHTQARGLKRKCRRRPEPPGTQ